MTEIRFLPEITDLSDDDWLVLQKVDITAITGKCKISNLQGVTNSELSSAVTALQTEIDNKAPTIHEHQIADIGGLQATLDSKADSSVVNGLEQSISLKANIAHSHGTGSIIGLTEALSLKAPIVHQHAISDVDGLQVAINLKADSTAVANTVSELQQEINGKAKVAHQHSITNIAELANLTENAAPEVDDFAIIQSEGVFQKARIAKLQPTSQQIFQWSKISQNSEIKLKSFVDTSVSDIVLTVPSNLVAGTEFEIKKISPANFVNIEGIAILDEYVLQSGDKIVFNDNQNYNTTTKLIYVDNLIGWRSYPSASFTLIKPLTLPTNKLHQLLYSGNITGLNNGSTIQTWIDSINGLNATQSTASLRPTLNTRIFGNGQIPGVFFDGQRFNCNFDWINNQNYTFCYVDRYTGTGIERRVPLGISSGTGSPYIIYENNTFGFMPYYNTASPSYAYGANTIATRIWMLSHNSREDSLWLNGVKVSNRARNPNTTKTSPAFLGSDIFSNNFRGWMCLLAGYLGDLTDLEIKTISDSANQTIRNY